MTAPPDGGTIGIVLILILVGIFLMLRPYKLAKVSEMTDSIGSKRSFTDVEPADWLVDLYRISGLILLLLVALMILGMADSA